MATAKNKPNPFLNPAPLPGAAPVPAQPVMQQENPAPVVQTPTPPTPMPGGAPAVMPGAAPADSFEVDLTDVQSSGYIIPDGIYHMRCIEVTQEVSKGGNPMYVWTFIIINQGPYSGREFRLFTALTSAAMWKVAETVTALGIGQVGEVVKFRRSDVINRECGAVIEEQEYGGRVNSNISKIIPMAELHEAYGQPQTGNMPK